MAIFRVGPDRPAEHAGVAVGDEVARSRLEHGVPGHAERQVAELDPRAQVPDDEAPIGAHGEEPAVAVDRRPSVVLGPVRGERERREFEAPARPARVA